MGLKYCTYCMQLLCALIVISSIGDANMIHDRNMSINKLIKDKQDPVNQNDTQHCHKALKKAMQGIASGPRYKMGKDGINSWRTKLSLW